MHGEYRLVLRDCEPGYRLSASLDGYAPAYYDHLPPWTITSAMDTPAPPPGNHDFVLEAAHTLDGVVEDDNGQPLTDVLVKAQTAVDGTDYSSFSSPSSPTAIPGKGIHQCTTDSQGMFHLDGLPPNKVHLTVTAPHRQVNSQNYPVDEPCRIVMDGSGRPGRLQAQVVNSETGEPVTNFSIAVRYRPERHAYANNSGVFSMVDEITAEEYYEVFVYSRGFAPTKTRLEATEVNGTESEELRISPAPPLEGVLLDGVSRRPIANASILHGVLEDSTYFEWADWEKYCDGMHSLTFVQRIETDGEGRFWFCEDAQAPGCLIVLAPGHARAIIRPEQRPDPEDDGVLEIPLKAEAVIGGVLPVHLTNQGVVNVQIWKERSNHGSLLVQLTNQRVVNVPIGRETSNSALDETFEIATADSQGRFEFRKLAPGLYHVGVEQPQGPWIRRTIPAGIVTVSEGEKADVSTLLASLTLRAAP
jgi:hypothetical protein